MVVERFIGDLNFLESIRDGRDRQFLELNRILLML